MYEIVPIKTSFCCSRKKKGKKEKKKEKQKKRETHKEH